ncbi:MAG: DUF4845 domain-containing protein [Pseudomonadota bacterium]
MAVSLTQKVKPRQRGLAFTTFLLALFIGVPVFITLMRTFPVYLEHFAIKRAMLRAAKECTACTKEEIRRIFDKQASIDEIASVRGGDLDVQRAAGKGEKGIVVVTSYARKQELIEGSGVSLLFEFEITEP